MFKAAQPHMVDVSLALGSNVQRFLSFETRPLSELAELVGVSKQAISRQIRHLLERGYVEVGFSEMDGRDKTARLTE